MSNEGALPSLASQLTRSLLWLVGCAWLLTAALGAWHAQTEINEGMDSTLMDSAQRLLLIAGPGVTAKDPRAQGVAATPDDHQFYQLVDLQGRVLQRSPDAPALALPLTPGFVDLPGWRVYSQRHATLPLWIHVADDAGHRREAMLQNALSFVLPLLAMLPALTLLIRWQVRRGLAPLRRLAAEIGRRSGQDLSPIAGTAELPAELQQIGASTNHLLLRLSEALDTEKALAANAAHELRTPLATLRLRLRGLLDMGLAPAARAQALSAEHSLLQLSRRTEKLLQLSRAESGAALSSAPVNLAGLAGSVAQEFWAADTELQARLRLQVPEDCDALALGDFDALAIVLRNLIENAQRHAPGRVIELSVEAPATLRVRDHGPGVPAMALAQIQQRHRRRPEAGTGYGLGLSIVATIIERHGGRLLLQAPRVGAGLEVYIELRPAGPQLQAPTPPLPAVLLQPMSAPSPTCLCCWRRPCCASRPRRVSACRPRPDRSHPSRGS